MKRNLIKIASLFFAIMLILFSPYPVNADELTGLDYTVEVIPNEEIEATLPDYLREALNDNNDSVVTRGVFKPDSDNVHNLTTDGKYSFYMESVLETTIYSNKVFTGHDGKIKFHIVDTSNDSGGYKVKVYKKGLFDTTVYTANCDGDTISDFTAEFDDVKAKVYFAIIPDGNTKIKSSSYIEKGA